MHVKSSKSHAGVYKHYMTCHKEPGGSPQTHRTVTQRRRRVRESERSVRKGKEMLCLEGVKRQEAYASGGPPRLTASPAGCAAAQQNTPAASMHGDSMRGCSASTNWPTRLGTTGCGPAGWGWLRARRVRARRQAHAPAVTRQRPPMGVQRGTGVGPGACSSGEVFHTAPAKGGKLRAEGGWQITGRNMGGRRASGREHGPAPARASGAQGRGAGSTGWSWGCRAAAETAGGVTAGGGRSQA